MLCLDMPFDLRGDYCEFTPFANYHPIFWAMHKQLVELLHGGLETTGTCMGMTSIRATIITLRRWDMQEKMYLNTGGIITSQLTLGSSI